MKTQIKRVIVGMFAGAMSLLGLALFPCRAYAQFDMGAIIAFLTSLNATMSSQIGIPMGVTATATTTGAAYQQQVVYSPTSIAQNRSMATTLSYNMQSDNQAFGQPVNSATLAQTRALENQVQGGNPNSVASAVGGNYTAVYGAEPASTTAPADTLAVVDMSDAQAQDALKTSIQMDAFANRESQLAQQMMNRLESASPGTAPMIAAQAAAWNLQGEAYSQKALAQLMRVESSMLSFEGYETKHAAAVQSQSVQQMQQVMGK